MIEIAAREELTLHAIAERGEAGVITFELICDVGYGREEKFRPSKKDIQG